MHPSGRLKLADDRTNAHRTLGVFTVRLDRRILVPAIFATYRRQCGRSAPAPAGRFFYESQLCSRLPEQGLDKRADGQFE